MMTDKEREEFRKKIKKHNQRVLDNKKNGTKKSILFEKFKHIGGSIK